MRQSLISVGHENSPVKFPLLNSHSVSVEPFATISIKKGEFGNTAKRQATHPGLSNCRSQVGFFLSNCCPRETRELQGKESMHLHKFEATRI
jgi:hypothetical protein